jgi:hypothetical protein
MSDDLKLPQVGELTLPRWQYWLTRYNEVLSEKSGRIEKLEAALRDCVNVLACFERPDFHQLERTSPIKPYALGALDSARKALEGKDD